MIPKLIIVYALFNYFAVTSWITKSIAAWFCDLDVSI